MDNAAQTAPKSRLSGLKVLVIDDSKTIRRTAETLLSKEGCEVFTAVDGFDAMTWRGLGFDAAIGPIAVMLGSAVVCAVLAVWRFRWQS